LLVLQSKYNKTNKTITKMKVEQVIGDLKKRFPNEAEYHQAVEEVLRSIEEVYNAHPEFENQNLIERLCIPERIFTFRITWIDDRGKVQTNMAYRVQHSNAIGPYKGGMRFHASVNLSILKFYPSVNHDILLQLIEHKIKCKDTMWLLEEIVRSPGGSANIPIGNYLSQYFANIYLNEFDHWLKEQCGARRYIRYGDDGVILDSDRSYLVDLKFQIEKYLRDKLVLQINPKSCIIKVDTQGIDFLGYRTYRNYTLLRKRSARKLKERVDAIVSRPENFGPQYIVSSVVSMLGWLNYCNSYNLSNKYIYSNTDLLRVFETSADLLEINKSNIMKLVRGI